MTNTPLEHFHSGDLTVGVVGLGYVGLPLSVEIARSGLRAVGFDVDAETVGGYTTNVLGKIAREGDRFNIANYMGLVTEMQGRRVSRVLLNRKDETTGQDASAEAQ